MNKRWIKPAVVMMSFVLLLQTATSAVFAATSGTTATTKAAASQTDPANTGLTIDAKSAILMDEDSGQVLFEQNADEALPPASMTKMMTEYLVLDSIKSGKIKWDDEVTVSDYSSAISKRKDLSGISKTAGEKYTAKDLFYALTIYSDNSAAISLAEFISGSEEKFVQNMNDLAVKMGLSKDAHFIDTDGLDRVDLGQWAPASIPGETIFSARDAALIAYHILHDHPEILEFSKIVSKKFRDTDAEPMINWDWMLEGNAGNTNFRQYVYQGLDGLKTGHTDNAGYCFTGTALRNGIRLISVVMNAKTRKSSFLETQKILDYGFNNFEKKEIIKSGITIDTLKTVPLKKGVKTEVAAITGGDLSLLVKKGTADTAFVKTTQAKAGLVAPLKKGDEVGTLTVTFNNKAYHVPMVAADDAPKGSWIRLFFRAIRNFVADLFKHL